MNRPIHIFDVCELSLIVRSLGVKFNSVCPLIYTCTTAFISFFVPNLVWAILVAFDLNHFFFYSTSGRIISYSGTTVALKNSFAFSTSLKVSYHYYELSLNYILLWFVMKPLNIWLVGNQWRQERYLLMCFVFEEFIPSLHQFNLFGE